jgi:hypothetical protein
MCDSEDSSSTVNLISYLFIGVGVLFSSLNLILIISNFKSMWNNTYARLMFLIQTLYLATCLVDLPHVFYGSKCELPASLFYFFWMVSLMPNLGQQSLHSLSRVAGQPGLA